MTNKVYLICIDDQLREDVVRLLKSIRIPFNEIFSHDVFLLPAGEPGIILWGVSQDPLRELKAIKRFVGSHPCHPVVAIMPLAVFETSKFEIPVYLEGVVTIPADPMHLQGLLEQAQLSGEFESQIRSLRHKIGNVEKEFEVFLKVGRTIASSLEFNEVLRSIMNITGRLLESEAWSVALLDPETDEMVFEAAKGSAGVQVKGMRIPRGKGIIGWVAEHGETLIVADTDKDQRHFKVVDQNVGFQSRSILCMPLKARGKVLGAIEFINKLDSQFTLSDTEHVQVFVDLAAVSLENALLYRRVAELSERDELTGLFNQKTLVKRLGQELEIATRNDRSLAYIFLDLDFFKRINDRLGHLMGRETLREVGELLRETAEGKEILGRYGGDEFWVIMPDTEREEALAAAEKIRKSIEGHVFLKRYNQEISLTASVGVAMFPDHALTFDDLARMADQALYQAKQEDRNKVILATPGS